MGCDIGKGFTRMITPSQQQIQFVQAITPMGQSLIAADLQKAQLQAAQSGFTGATAGMSGYGYTGQQLSWQQQQLGMKPAGGIDTETAVGIGIGVLLIGTALVLLLKK